MSQKAIPLIRDFTAGDLPAILQLYQVAVPDESRAEGYTPDELAKQARAMVAGNMVLFKILMRLMQQRWALLVAEEAGQVVGLGGFRGSAEVVEFGPLMVLPEFRRQGVGAALTQARLARAKQLGVSGVYVGPLTTNQASLGNLSKNGFALYRYHTGYEITLPWAPTVPQSDVHIRPAQATDRVRLTDFETRAFGPDRLTREGGRVRFFCPGWAQKAYRRWLTKDKAVALIAEHAGQIVATAELLANAHTPKGRFRLEKDPATAPEAVELLLLRHAAHWLTAQGKQVMRVYLPGQIAPPAFAAPENQYCWAYMFRRL